MADTWKIVRNLWDTFDNNPDNQRTVDSMKGMLGLLPAGAGDVASGLLAADDVRRGDYLSAGLNGVGMLPYVPSLAGMFIGKNSKVWDALKADEAQKMLSMYDDAKSQIKNLNLSVDKISDGGNLAYRVTNNGEYVDRFPSKEAADEFIKSERQRMSNLVTIARQNDPKEVWKKTGTFKGVDGALRQEIDDSASIPGHRLYSWGEREDLKQGNSTVVRRQKALLHPKLSAAYPETKTIPVFLKPGSESGSFANDPSFYGPQITAGASRENGAANKSVMLHELQHAIQEREGWARGGSPDQFKVAPEMMQGMHSLDDMMQAELIINRAKEYGMSVSDFAKNPPRWATDNSIAIAKRFENKPDDFKYSMNYILGANDPQEAYKRLAGEAESRLTQSRMNMTMPERLQVYPYDMLDVPQDQLIVRGLLGM